MSETNVIVNSANELLLLANTEVRHVPLKDIAQTSLKGLRRQEGDVELYEFLFANIIHLFEPHEFEQEVSCVLLPELVFFLEKIQAELQTNALSYFFVENLNILLRLAEVLLKLVEYLTAQAEEQCQLLRSIVIFPEYLLRCYTIVRKNYVSMAHEPQALDAMKALYAVCKKMLMAFLDLLCPRESSRRGSYFRSMDHEVELECLEKVCTLLASASNEISPIDSLLASDIWKAIVKLCTEHAEQLITCNQTAWLCETITILNTGIDTSLSDMRAKNEPSKQSTIALKLNAFFLRVMLKLLTLSKQHVSEDVFASIISTLLQVKASLGSKTLCSELLAGIEQYLHIGYMAIVESSCRIESFAKALTKYECKTPEEVHSFYPLTMHIISQMVSNANDTSLLSLYCYRNNLLQQVCNLLKRSNSFLYHDATLYKKLLVHCAGVVLMGVRCGKDRTAQKTIEETLVHMILQEHYYTALLGIDLWSIFVRYHSTQLMYAYFLFWKKCNDQYAIFTTRPTQVYVRQLLRNLYIFLPVTHKEKLLDTFPVSDRANDRLWAALEPGLCDGNGMDETRRKQFASCLEKRLCSGMKALQRDPENVDSFYDVLGVLAITGVTSKTIEISSETFWNSQLEWNAAIKAYSTGSIFDCLERNSARITLGCLLNSTNASALSEARSYVKYQIAKLLRIANLPATAQDLLEMLLKDNVPLVAAIALHSLYKLKEKKCPIAHKILCKQPKLQSQLLRWQNITTTRLPPLRSSCTLTAITHQCQQIESTESSESLGDLTLAINNKIDELFPDDDDDDIEDIDVNMFTDGGALAAKKRKFDATTERDGEQVNPTQCLSELQNATTQLGRYVEKQSLQAPEKAQLQRIISSLTNALDRPHTDGTIVTVASNSVPRSIESVTYRKCSVEPKLVCTGTGSLPQKRPSSAENTLLPSRSSTKSSVQFAELPLRADPTWNWSNFTRSVNPLGAWKMYWQSCTTRADILPRVVVNDSVLYEIIAWLLPLIEMAGACPVRLPHSSASRLSWFTSSPRNTSTVSK
uniref:Uncharacterized protein n=1 Tax=Anopheles dirus TaxID=7168 RepID=A0A182NM21_9DIPT